MQKLGLTLLIALAYLQCPPAFAKTGDAAWFQEALTEEFRSQPASGTVDNDTLTFDLASLQPEKGGFYTLDLMKQLRKNDYRITRIRFPHDGKFEGQTITFPLIKGKQEGTIDVMSGNQVKHYSKTCEGKYIYGRITFGTPKGTDVPGYICLHFRSKEIFSSQINGYFHATLKKAKRKNPKAMFE